MEQDAVGADSIVAELAIIWKEVLGVPIAPSDDFFALGGDSISATHIMNMASETLGMELPMFLIYSHTTVEELAAGIANHALGAASAQAVDQPQILVELKSGGHPALYCVPAAAKSVLSLKDLPARFSQDQSFFAIESCGFVPATQPQNRVEDMARTYNAAVRAQQPRGPYFLSGRCFGGIVAFEMARQLIAAGERVDLLALMDAPVPAFNLEAVLANLEPAQQRRVRAIYPSDQLCAQAMLASLEQEFRANLEQASEEIRRDMIAVEAAHRDALLNYIPSPIDAAITVFRSRGGSWNERIAWDLYTRSTYRCFELEGDRVSVFQKPRVFDLSAALSDAFGRSRARTDAGASAGGI